MDDPKQDEARRNRAFDPDQVEDFLGTGGGLPGELAGQAMDRWENQATERWRGTQLGPYRITDVLGRGGMALVFRAERCDGRFEQEVAIKLLRSPESAELAERFVREQQFLARLKYPGIAHIIDSGVVDGQPWIAIELVDGLPMVEFCDQRELGLIQRLELFIRAARAVQFAHGQLVVHRDLKPSNILVTDDAQPKLLDFGIAKALQGSDSDLTGPAVLMTPLYASPEQVLGEPVGVASDIYQLGLLLYRLLTGRDAQAMDQASVARIKSVVVDDDPLTPSVQVETTGRQNPDQLDQIARQRSTSPARLCRRLSGDLDAVVMKALQKDPQQRYATVENFIADVLRYCELRPVLARPASRLYRAQRFAARHRGGVLAGLLTGLVLLISLIAVGLSWRTTIKAQSLALDEAQGAREVSDFLAHLLEQADPSRSGGDELTVRELLDAGADELAALDHQPRVQARLREVIAGAYESLALPDLAEPLARDALAVRERLDDLPGAVQPLSLLASIRMQQGDLDDALELGERAVAASRDSTTDPASRALALDALATVLAQRGSYAEERQQLTLAVAAAKGVDGVRGRQMQASTLMKLGSNSRQTGDYGSALGEFERALALLGDTPGERVPRMFTLRELGTLHSNLGDESRAVELLSQSLELARRIYGDGSANILGNLVLLGRSLGNLNRTDEAMPLFEQALAVAADTIGKTHGNYARILHDYAEILSRKGDFEAVRRIRDEAVQIADGFFGPDHSTTVNLRKARAFVPIDEGRYLEAAAALTEVLPAVRQAFGDRHMITFNTQAAIAEAMLESGRFIEAGDLMIQLRESGQEIAEGRFFTYQRNLADLARLQLLTGTLSEAAAFADEAVNLRRDMTSDQGLPLVKPLATRAKIRLAAADARAEDDLDQALALLASDSSPLTLPMAWFLSELAATLAHAGRHDDAKRLCGDALASLQTSLPANHPILGYSQGHCGEAALKRGSRGEATHLLGLALTVITQTLEQDNWRSQWTQTLLATAQDNGDARASTLARLRQSLGDNSPIMGLLPQIPAQ